MELDTTKVIVISDVADAHYGSEDVPDEVVDPRNGNVIGTTNYHHTDGWRGYWEIKPAEGYKKVGDGTHCGEWEDAPHGTSTKECEAYLADLVEEYGEVFLVFGGSSNLFSMTYDVLATA